MTTAQYNSNDNLTPEINELLSKKEIISMNSLTYRSRLKKDLLSKFRLGTKVRTSDRHNPESASKITADPRFAGNPLDLQHKSTICALFKAKSVDPKTYSPPSLISRYLVVFDLVVKVALLVTEIFRMILNVDRKWSHPNKKEWVLYSAANDPRPQMIPRPKMIPKWDRKWSPTSNDPRPQIITNGKCSQVENDPQISPHMVPKWDRKWSHPKKEECNGVWFPRFLFLFYIFLFSST